MHSNHLVEPPLLVDDPTGALLGDEALVDPANIGMDPATAQVVIGTPDVAALADGQTRVWYRESRLLEEEK